MMIEVHVYDQLPDYALDCLDGEEKLQVEVHLNNCDLCRAELLVYQDLVTELPFGMKIVEPNPKLKYRILKQIKTRKYIPEGEIQPSIFKRFNHFIFGQGSLWGYTSLAIILILAVSNLYLWQQVNILQTPIENRLNTITLSGTAFTPDATGLLVVSRDGEHGTLVVDGLPELGEAQQYQLWLIQNGDRTSGGVFSVSRDGYGSIWVSAPLPLADYSTFGITIEPAGGSPGPTGEKVLGGNL